MINIITPCSRPQNLHTISKSINIPKDQYRWIVVFDMEICDTDLIPTNCIFLYHKDPNSISGNAQRNMGIELIEDGYVYFLDDDTILHPALWDNIKDATEDMILFNQLRQGQQRFDRLRFEKGYIDTGCAVIKSSLIGDTRWELGVYEADYFFLQELKYKTQSIKNIPHCISYYNYLKYGY